MFQCTLALTMPVLVLAVPLPYRVNNAAKAKGDPLIAEMKFVRVPQGTFWMGWDSFNRRNWRGQVTIERDFEMAAYAVTQGQWQAIMSNNPSWFSRHGNGKDAVEAISDLALSRFPVESVSWDDVQEFVKKLNAREKGKGWTYRLPTETEWEYACRGAARTKEECSYDFYFATPTNDLTSDQANFYGERPAGKAAKGRNLGRPTMVGSYAPNKLGLYDMHGNIWQWCEDLEHVSGARMIRGGCWFDAGETCRTCPQTCLTPSHRGRFYGFRLVRVETATRR